MIFFFIPCALVSAELSTLFPQKGGIYIWVKEALGHRMGFVAVWLLWVENIVFYPAILSFITAAIAYVFFPHLSDNPLYTCVGVIIVFWALTLLNLRGIHFTGKLSTFCVIVGTFIPTALILVLGAIYLFSGKPFMISLKSTPIFPDLSQISTFSVLTGILLSFAGLEMPAIHAGDVENPKKNFPIAIFLSAAIIVILTILGTLSIAIVVPSNEISLVSGTIFAVSAFLKQYNLSSLTPIVSLFIAIGALGGISNWIVGPCRGLLTAGEKGDFPPFMQKTNKHGMPIVLMFIQAIIVSALSILFLLMPNVSSSFWMMTVLAAQLYILMYILLFISGIVLKKVRKNDPRPYAVPFGTLGMTIVAGFGLIGVLFSFVIGFFPPPDINGLHLPFFVSFLTIGIVIMTAIPFIIFEMRKPHWGNS